MVLTKEEFCGIMDDLRESDDVVNKVNDIFQNSRQNVKNDFLNGAALQICHKDIVIMLLKKMFDDICDVDYFVYELDYGRKYKPGMITDADGNDIDESTAEKLYNVLVDNMRNN